MTEMDDPIPQTMDQWRRCIEVDCGIPLTVDFAKKRIQDLEDSGNFHTQRFIECYGTDHHQRVLSWFRQVAAG